MEQPVKDIPKKVAKFGADYTGPKGVRYVAEERPRDIGLDAQAKETAKQNAEPIVVPLHLGRASELDGNAARLANVRIAENAVRMYQANSRGFRQQSARDALRGLPTFLEGKFIAAGLTTPSAPTLSKRAVKKRLHARAFSEAYKANPKQGWSNWQRTHNGELRAAA